VAFVAVPVNGRAPNRSAGAISLVDVSTGKTIRKIEPSVPVVGYAFSPDGRVLATQNADDSVSLWEVAGGKERARLGPVAPPAPATTTVPAPPLPVVRVAGLAPAGADASTQLLARR
jgi:WD40 repeat protein